MKQNKEREEGGSRSIREIEREEGRSREEGVRKGVKSER
jgi:hypothetical protein